MKKHKLLAAILCLLAGKLIFAQSTETVKKYIATFKDIAVAEEIRTGVPAAITLAQGIHETGAGTSDLVIASNNHFGIKCKGDWTGPTVFHDDDAKGECFRKYSDPADSYRDHSDFLKNRPYYAALFKLDPADYKGWAYGLKKAGYATNPKYALILIKLIEEYDLQEYTLLALKGGEEGNNGAIWASNTAKTENEEEPKTMVRPMVQKSFVQTDYPSGVFKINETSVVFVVKGTSFLKIAEDNHVSLAKLFEFNDMKAVDVASRDGLIYLQRKKKTGATDYHVVAEGETLYDIAQSEGLRLENLMEYNFLKQDMQPQPGEKLNLRSKAPSMPRLVSEGRQLEEGENHSVAGRAAGNEGNGFILHVVQPKETMYAISKKYDVAVDDVMRWNDMQTAELKTGQQIRISKKSSNATN